MIGRATASVQPPARRLIQRVWGVPDMDTRQKWAAVWPALTRLPRESIRLLDAGCGDGAWTLELARRRPHWRLVGIDREAEGVADARRDAARLAVDNARFLTADFLHFRPDERFDAVLSVASAHYLADDGRSALLFDRFAEWLAPGGWLLLYGPRRRQDVPALGGLPPPFDMRDVFAAEDLARLCDAAGLQVETLGAVVCRMGTWAKQLGRFAGSSLPARALVYPLQLALARLDGLGAPADAAVRSSALLLVARKPTSSP